MTYGEYKTFINSKLWKTMYEGSSPMLKVVSNLSIIGPITYNGKILWEDDYWLQLDYKGSGVVDVTINKHSIIEVSILASEG